MSVGDEVTDPAVLKALVEHEAVDALALDVVAIGGVTPARELIAWASDRGVPASGHVYPEVTAHLGIGVETFARGVNPYDPAPSFIVGGPVFDGAVRPADAPVSASRSTREASPSRRRGTEMTESARSVVVTGAAMAARWPNA